jgi:hypothetical protein
MKKKVVLGLSSALVLSLLIGSLAEGGNLLNVRGETVNAQSCGTILFGEGTTADSGTALTAASYTMTGLDGLGLSASTITKVYSKAAGNPARFGTNSAVGELTFSFSSSVITSVRLYAYQYGNDGEATVSLSTSAISANPLTASVTVTSAPSLDSLSGDGIYLFTGLDQGNGTSSTSLTVKSDGSNRFYLAKILLTLNGSASPASSSVASSSSSSKTSSAGASSQSSGATYYRVASTLTTASTAPIYDVTFSSGSYIGTQITTISKTQDCLTYEDVCAYYAAYRQVPPNYKTSKALALKYGTAGRVVSTYVKGEYSGSNDYSVKLGTFRNSSGDYLELDIDLDGTYNDGSTITRGAGRVVVVVDGISEYSDSSPVCFYTADHYTTLQEYHNRYHGWSADFTSYDTHAFAPTVTFTVA